MLRNDKIKAVKKQIKVKVERRPGERFDIITTDLIPEVRLALYSDDTLESKKTTIEEEIIAKLKDEKILERAFLAVSSAENEDTPSEPDEGKK